MTAGKAKGPEPCNTGPAKCNRPTEEAQEPFDPSKVRVVNWGVDAMYTTYDGDLWPWLLAGMESLKMEAQEGDAPVHWPDGMLFGEPMVIHQRGGVRGYKYHVSNSKVDAFLVGAGENQPALWLQPRAEFLKEVGPDRLVELQRQEVAKLFRGTPQERANRLDLHVDLTGVPWTVFGHRITDDRVELANATYRAQDVQSMCKRGKLTGFNVGKRTGSTYLRMYDKTQELADGGHLAALAEGEVTHYLPVMWKENGWAGQIGQDEKERPIFERVIRVEYELSREALKQFRKWNQGEVFVETWDQALPLLDSIWQYCILKWFVVRVPGEAKQKTRWQKAEWWVKLADLKMAEGPQAIGARVYQRGSSERKLAQLLAGCTATVGALNGLTEGQAYARVVALVQAEFQKRKFGERVGKKVRSLRTRMPLEWVEEQEQWRKRPGGAA